LPSRHADAAAAAGFEALPAPAVVAATAAIPAVTIAAVMALLTFTRSIPLRLDSA
jgi:hypothetical protein